ncbi:MAG: M48 family metallopeptidase [Methylococcales bacterium]|nr:M48 family metallopeptidase [Methylococcales bacterium]
MTRKIKTITFNYTIRRSQRAKKIRIIVTSEKIEVVAPLRVSERMIHDFISQNQDWVEVASNKVKKIKNNIKKLAPDTYSHGVFVPFRGNQVRIRLEQSLSTTIQVAFDGNEFCVSLLKPKGDNSELIRTALIEWMKKQASIDVESYVNLYTKKYNLYPRYVKIKAQKSRWGSCGIHNDINLNWLLILAPSDVMAYVVVHELCHIKERNHSMRFWTLVEKHFPSYQEQRNWLKKNGSSLAL